MADNNEFSSGEFSVTVPMFYIYGNKPVIMSILNNNKKTNSKQQGSNKNTASNNSKFIKSASSKAPNVAKKTRSTGANRGS
jgi:hypothetical protein